MDSQMEKPKKDTSLEELSNKQLQEKLVNFGMPEEDVSKINVKSTLISMVNALNVKDAQIAEAEMKSKENEKKDSSDEKVNPSEEKRVEKNWTSKAHKQWNLWSEQPTIRILVPLVGKEVKGVVRFEFSKKFNREIPVHVRGAVQTVIENGAQYVIPKGEYVDVPEAVGKIIQKKFQQTSEAGKDYLIDRMDPSTGKPVSDRLR